METVKSFLYGLGFNPSADGTLYLRKAIIARIANPKAQLTDLCAPCARTVEMGATVAQMQREMREVIRAACANDVYDRISKKLHRAPGADGAYSLGDFIDLTAAYFVASEE